MILSNLNQLKTFANPIFEMGKKISVTIWKPNRSNRANRYYWLCLTTISDHTGYTPNQIHEYFKKMFLEKNLIEVFGEYINDLPSTATLNSSEFSNYMQQIIVYSHTEIEVILPDPADYNLKRIAEFYKEQINR